MGKVLAIVALFCVTFSIVQAASENCGKILENDVGPEDQKIVVNKHNDLRNQINEGKVPGQPRANPPLPNLKWDVALAKAAQDISDTCIFKHVAVPDARFYVGQNLFAWWSTGDKRGADWDGAIQAWFNEYPKFTYPGPFGGAGHYTQIVWHDTQYVGCGYTGYSQGDKNFNKLYVCNYGPGGNYVGQAPYQI